MTNSGQAGWWRAAAVLTVAFAVFALFWPAASLLGALWLDDDRNTYTHGFLIALVACVLIWRGCATVAAAPAMPPSRATRLAAAAALLVMVLAWQIAYRAGILVAIELLMLPILWCVIFLLFGRSYFRATFFGVGYLLFALPVWDFFNPLAQSASVHAVRLMLRLADVPAVFEGNFVRIASGRFEIAEGCSGLHFIIVALAIAALIGELRRDVWRLRARWLFAGLAIALLVNWVRIFTIILAGHFSQMQHYLVRESHYGFGWLVFLLGLVLLFALERRAPPPAALPVRATAPAGELASAPARHPLTWYAAIAVVLAAPQWLNAIIDARTFALPAASESAELPSRWTARAESHEWRPIQNNADSEGLWLHSDGKFRLERYVAKYHEQGPGKKLGGYSNRLQGDAAVLDSGVQSVGGRSLGQMQLEFSGARSVMWFRYRVEDRDFTSAMRAQLWYGWRTLVSLQSPLSEVRALRARCEPSCAVATHVLATFLTDNHGEL